MVGNLSKINDRTQMGVDNSHVCDNDFPPYSIHTLRLKLILIFQPGFEVVTYLNVTYPSVLVIGFSSDI